MPTPDCLLLGRLQRDTILTSDGRARVDELGGNLLYAAAACQLLGGRPGLVARVGADAPADWLPEMARRELDTRGIHTLAEPQNLLRFIAYNDAYTPNRDQPIKHFARWGLPLPKPLLHYANPEGEPDSTRQRGALTLRPEDLPEEYHGARAAHLCPVDYLSHAFMPVALREAGTSLITLEAGGGYMLPAFWNEFPDLVNGLSVFVTSEERLLSLFSRQGNSELWQMAEAVASFNCAAVIVRSLARGDWLYDGETGRRYHLPPFPARTYDITDNGSSFCGALVAQLAQGRELPDALLTAAATASLAVEGSGAFYISDTFPGLVEARAESLQQALKSL
ncbi:MAG: carbohydrate kinase family protein [Anaerolineales bacterium]|nr:carbohydrate kinase family protein [Anaerolineales bacterium]